MSSRTSCAADAAVMERIDVVTAGRAVAAAAAAAVAAAVMGAGRCAHLKLLGRASDEPREQFDPHVGHPLLQHAEVLRGEHGGGREEGDLPPVGDGAVDGPHRHL